MEQNTDKAELTTIQVSIETRERIKKLGRKGETYDGIINRVFDQAPMEGF
jgi:hypothetical protein